MVDQADSDCTNRLSLFGVPLPPSKENPFLHRQDDSHPLQHHHHNRPWVGEVDFKEEDIKYASERMQTFQNWPKILMPNPSQLASAGFIYWNRGDRVRCFSCGLVLCAWKRSDIPLVEYYKWLPD